MGMTPLHAACIEPIPNRYRSFFKDSPTHRFVLGSVAESGEVGASRRGVCAAGSPAEDLGERLLGSGL